MERQGRAFSLRGVCENTCKAEGRNVEVYTSYHKAPAERTCSQSQDSSFWLTGNPDHRVWKLSKQTGFLGSSFIISRFPEVMKIEAKHIKSESYDLWIFFKFTYTCSMYIYVCVHAYTETRNLSQGLPHLLGTWLLRDGLSLNLELPDRARCWMSSRRLPHPPTPTLQCWGYHQLSYEYWGSKFRFLYMYGMCSLDPGMVLAHMWLVEKLLLPLDFSQTLSGKRMAHIFI